MTYTLNRTSYSEDGVFGIVINDEGHTFYTLEHAFYVNGAYVPKVTAGTYTCVRYDSPDHGYQVFTLKDVPDFQGQPVSYIEIHIGNYNKDSDGCILLGENQLQNMITDSKDAFQKFMLSLAGQDSFQLVVKD
jgi:hypothetical protein